MQTPRRFLQLFALAFSFLLLVAACGDAESTATSTGAGSSSQSDSSSDEAAPAEAASDDEDASDEAAPDDEAGGPDDDGESISSIDEMNFRSPIAEFLGQDFGDFESMEADFAEMEIEAEIKTAECMQELGFEYTPRSDTGPVIFSAGVDQLDPFSDEYVETFGFGISTQMFPQSMVGEGLVGFPDEMAGIGPDFDPPEDPNQEYVDSLSPGAQEAYYEALHGKGPDFDPSSMTEEEMNAAFEDFRPSGCANEAREEMFNSGPFGPDNGFEEAFGDQLDNLYERVEADPRIVAVESEIASCVSERGLVYEGRGEELWMRFSEPLDSIGMMAFGDPFEGTGLNPDEMTQEEINDFFENLPPPQLSADDKATLARVQAEEIELAIAVRDCGGSERDQMELFNQVRIELEEDFLAKNADALAEFADN